MDQQERFDRIDVADIILRERLARDNRQWEEMAACYHPDSVVEVSWFKGSGAQFVEMSTKAVRPGSVNFHIMTPPVVTVRKDRAISETPCILRSFSMMNGVEISFEGFVRLFWRAQREGDQWLIAGLRCVYLKDEIHGRNPNKQPVFDEALLDSYRDSYRYTSANLANLGISVTDDLPGIDRPEMAADLRAGEEAWLAGA
ncbi:MAG: nuclear transport factor 2 family protein [Sphingobium sp.]